MSFNLDFKNLWPYALGATAAGVATHYLVSRPVGDSVRNHAATMPRQDAAEVVRQKWVANQPGPTANFVERHPIVVTGTGAALGLGAPAVCRFVASFFGK